MKAACNTKSSELKLTLIIICFVSLLSHYCIITESRKVELGSLGWWSLKHVHVIS